MKSKSFINKLSLSNELPLYLLIFPYFINFAISGSEIQGSKLIQISGFGIIASVIPFIVGYIFRR
ncbi:MAG: methyl-accepting chemotaxis protein, partial [Leptospira sp.]|nr:methyl-accepting chemotaxis protein [Leptospira sp.]